MSVLSTPSPQDFGLLTQSMIQACDLPLSEVLDCSVIADAFEDDSIDFEKADEAVFTPTITLWAMVSQMLFSGTGRSCKADDGRVVSQNAGNYCLGERQNIKTFELDESAPPSPSPADRPGTSNLKAPASEPV